MSIKARVQQYKGDMYPDGITRITDAFWHIKCKECGKIYYSVTYKGKCPECGSEDGNATLDGKTLEEVVRERKNQSLEEFLKENPTLQQFIRTNNS